MADLPPAADRRQAPPSALLKPDLAQYLRLMLAEVGRTAVKRERVRAHQDRTANAGRPLRLDPHPARLELRIFEQVGDCVDRAGRDDRLFQRGEKVVALP